MKEHFINTAKQLLARVEEATLKLYVTKYTKDSYLLLDLDYQDVVRSYCKLTGFLMARGYLIDCIQDEELDSISQQNSKYMDDAIELRFK